MLFQQLFGLYFMANSHIFDDNRFLRQNRCGNYQISAQFIYHLQKTVRHVKCYKNHSPIRRFFGRAELCAEMKVCVQKRIIAERIIAVFVGVYVSLCN